MIFVIPILAQNGIPLNLSFPFDGDTITNREPVLIWQTDLSVFSSQPRNTLDLVIAEIKENQTANEAIHSNTPTLYKTNVSSNTYSLTLNEIEIKPNTWYAWQVRHVVLGTTAQETDTWKFIYVEPKTDKIENGFVEMKEFDDATFIAYSEPVLYFLCREPEFLNLAVNISGEDISLNGILLNELVDGKPLNASTSESNGSIRFFKLDLSKQSLKKGYYKLDWNYSNNRSRTINFELK